MASLLSEQRRKEIEDYRELKVKLDLGAKVSDFTQEEIIQLEDLSQLAKNGELSRQNGHRDLVFLRNAKAARVKQRLTEGKPPFEETCFGDRWDWVPEERKYVWKAEEGNNPSNFAPEGFSWQPREIHPPISSEGENTRL